MKSISLTFATSALIQLVTIVSGVIVARLLGPQGRGELAAIFLWAVILVDFGTLGLMESVTYAAARRAA